jgi:hypothetical protein
MRLKVSFKQDCGGVLAGILKNTAGFRSKTRKKRPAKPQGVKFELTGGAKKTTEHGAGIWFVKMRLSVAV